MSSSNYSIESEMKNLSLHNNSSYELPGYRHDNVNDDDDRPLSYHQQQHDLNSAQLMTQKRPLPPSHQTSIPNDIAAIQSLYDTYLQKIYFEGHILLKQGNEWFPWYLQLSGPTLTLWEDTLTKKAPYASYQIIDAVIRFLGRVEQEGHNNVFSIILSEQTLLLDAPDYQTLISWIAAFRLSCFEWAKIQECFTRRLLSRPMYGDALSKSNLTTHLEGPLQVRLDPLSHEWRTYWVVVSDRPEPNNSDKEEKKKSKLKLFGGSKKKKSEKKELFGRGQLLIYESSEKTRQPILTLVNVVQSYMLYNLQNANLTDVFKVEGNNLGQNGTSTILIKAASLQELVQWTVATFDAFKLYGRPNRLSDDPFNINSLNFGEQQTKPGTLFLELSEVLNQLNVDFVHDTLLDTKAQFTGCLLHKVQQQRQQHYFNAHHHHRQQQQQQQQQPMGLIHQIPTGTSSSTYSSRPPSQRTSVHSSQSSSINTPINRPQLQPQQKRTSNNPIPITITASGRQVYASDDSSDDNEEEQESEDESDDDHDSVFEKSKLKVEKKTAENIQQQPPLNAPIPTTTSNNKKQVVKKEDKESEDEFGLLSDSSNEKKPRATENRNSNRPKPRMSRTQVSISDSDSEEEEEIEHGRYSGNNDDVDSDDDVPIQQHYQQRQQDSVYYEDRPGGLPWDSASMMMEQQQQYHHPQAYYDQGYPEYDENGPIIPQLGDRFATQNSLLDTYRLERGTAHDQEGYARATGQPLIQVPNKPPEPRAGLVGMISQIEHEKKQKEANKHLMMNNSRERMMMMEREKYLLEQRAQQQQQQMMPSTASMINPIMNPSVNTLNPSLNALNPSMNVLNSGMNMMNPMMYSNMMPIMSSQMSMMSGQMPMVMNPMMYPTMMQQSYPGMMPNMMDPRLLLLQQQQQQQQLWQQQQMLNSRFNTSQQSILEDEDDDIPLGTKDTNTAIPPTRHK